MYDVVIIGAGSAGLAARLEVSRTTSNYLVIDSGPLGTTCARVGCMPSKVLIEAAEIFAQSRKFGKIGVHLPQAPVVNGRELMRHVRSLRDHYVGHVVAGMEQWRATHFVAGEAKFVAPDTIMVGDRRVTAKKFIIATGSRPAIPKPWASVPGLLTTDDIFEIEDLPKSLIVIGSGAIGLELGQAFARFNVEVTVIGELSRLGGLTDKAVIENARRTLSQDFALIDGSVESITKLNQGYEVSVGGERRSGERVLVAVGRQPNVEKLDLGAAGAHFNHEGLPEFSTKTMRLAGTKAYFVGDVNKDRPVLHEAVDQGRIAATNAVATEDREFPCKARLSIVFTQPQIATVGRTQRQLEKEGLSFAVGNASFANQGRAVAKLKNDGHIKVYAERESGRILGAELFAPEGEHLAHLLAWAIEAQRTVFCLLAYPVYHPTLEEGLRTALKNAARETHHGGQKLSQIRCDDAPADLV